jgi:predicted acylesterase/phospholipase RssA
MASDKKSKPPRYFVIAGGASHGTTLWGAVQAGLRHFTPAGWAGASIGAVIAAGMALGLDPVYLEQQMVSLFQKNKLTGGKKVIRIHPRLLTRASGMHDWTHVQAALKVIFKDARMRDVKAPLCIVVGDVYAGVPRYITSWEDPDVLIWQALSASTAVWPVGAAQEIPSLGTGNRLHVDGGWGNNCPHEVFADREAPTISFYLARKDGDRDGQPDPTKREGVLGILEACLELSLYVEPNIGGRADDIAVPIVPSGSGLDFDLAPTEIRRRVLDGFAQARTKLQSVLYKR